MIPMPGVQHLADRFRPPPMLHEVLRHGDGIGNDIAKVLPQTIDAQRCGAGAQEQIVSRRSTHRLVAIRPIEAQAPRRQPVDVRRFYERVAVTSEVRLQIVNANEQDIGTCYIGGPDVFTDSAPRGAQQDDEQQRDSLHGWTNQQGRGSRCVQCDASATA